MKTKNITITVPVLPNPLTKLKETRKGIQRAYYAGKMQYQYSHGDTAGAFITYHHIKSI